MANEIKYQNWIPGLLGLIGGTLIGISITLREILRILENWPKVYM